MILKAAYKYQLSERVKPIIVYYFCILAVTVLIGTISIAGSEGSSSFNGIEFSTTIFLFIVGLISFKEPFLMLIQNGVSRKSFFASNTLIALSVALTMTIVDKGVYFFSKAIALASGGHLHIMSLYEQIYRAIPLTAENAFPMHMKMSLYYVCMYLAAISCGFFITILFYRLPKLGKIAVGAGVPVCLFIALPILDAVFFNMSLTRSFVQFMDFAFGYTSCNPYAAMLTLIVSFIMFSLLSWLLIRKVPVKS